MNRFARVALAMLGVLPLQSVGAEVTPPCRVAATEDEKNLAAETKRAIADLDRFVSGLAKQLVELENALAQPDAGPELVEVYREMRLNLDATNARRAEFEKLAAIWCNDERH